MKCWFTTYDYHSVIIHYIHKHIFFNDCTRLLAFICFVYCMSYHKYEETH